MLLFAAGLGCSVSASEPGFAWHFEDVDAGSLPKELQVIQGRWSVIHLPEGKVLEQATENGRVPALLDFTPNVLHVRVRQHVLSERPGAGAGVLWGYSDAHNYSMACYYPNACKVELVRIVDGESSVLATGSTSARTGWRELKVQAIGNRVRCSVDDDSIVSAEDPSIHEGKGKVGLISVDSVVRFDDLWVRISPDE